MTNDDSWHECRRVLYLRRLRTSLANYSIAMKLNCILIVATTVFGSSNCANADEPDGDREAKQAVARLDPVVRDIEGWTVHIDPVLLEGEHAELGSRALRVLADHLNRISLLVEDDALEKLKTCEIWIEHRHPSLDRMQYHPSKAWLREHGHDVRLARKVTFPEPSRSCRVLSCSNTQR